MSFTRTPNRQRSSRRGGGKARRHRLTLSLEQLERRHLLAGNPWTWFESFDDVPRVDPALLDDTTSRDTAMVGPHDLVASEWIVQLANSEAYDSLESLDKSLDEWANDFTVIAGLGSPGLVLLRARGTTTEAVEASLRSNPAITEFSRNALIQGQETTPNDTEFVRGAMQSLTSIGLPNAWDGTIGSLGVVTGVLDTGIDLAHRDLYLNIWFNQGEIPSRFLDDDGNKLVDIDGDGLITFYDLNNVTRSNQAPFSVTFNGVENGPNAEFVTDLNGNGYIDGLDILADPLWADGRDTDGNSEVDDFFGVNFRGGGVRNNPTDQQGHGTHVAGTIGAVGGNAIGVTGVNWQTSLMSLRILDDNNQGDTGAAIRALNYARDMRERFSTENNGRVIAGANVRVVNNSWGQPGGFESSLETVIEESGDAGILFVAASGNGNFLGQGVDNDRTPFFPASYESPSVIAVGASTFDDSLASFSNFGNESVDLVAPGTGIRSTELGGGFGTRNGTSMAAPHVAGTAALILAALPDATLDEVREALLSTVLSVDALENQVSTSGRLNAEAAFNADVFAPAARLIAKQDIADAGGVDTEITVEYFHRSGMDVSTIGNDDLLITREWGPADELVASLIPGSIVTEGDSTSASYIIQAPGGSWDFLDFGDYRITTVANAVSSVDAQRVQQRDLGSFNVRIEDSNVIYVQTVDDVAGEGSLRDAIMEANEASGPRTIILDTGSYSLGTAHVSDPQSTFPDPEPNSRCELPGSHAGWSNATTGDLDITGSVTIIGNQNDLTTIDGQSFDRVFKVHPGAQLELARVTVTGGVAPADQGGGGILSAGDLTLRETIVRGNSALGDSINDLVGGGGVAVWNGNVNVVESWLDENEANFGGGIFVCGAGAGSIVQSTVSNNQGGGLHSHSSSDLIVSNSTFSSNKSGNGAIFNNQLTNGESSSPSLSADGRFMAFESESDTLVPGDTNGTRDIFVLDNETGEIDRVSVASDGSQASQFSFSPSISGDGRFVAFRSNADNLVPDDTNASRDIFVFDRLNRTTERINVSDDGTQASAGSRSEFPVISDDGRFVAFRSDADNLVPGDTNNSVDIFVRDRIAGTIERVNVANDGTQSEGFFNANDKPSISADGRFVAFESNAENLVPGNTNQEFDVYVYDRSSRTIERVSVAADGVSGFGGNPTLSPDGRFVLFESFADDLVPIDTNGQTDLFLVDRDNDTIERVSVASDGTQTNSFSGNASISADGRLVAFVSNADNLVAGDTNLQDDIFVHDRSDGTTERLNLDNPGGQMLTLLNPVLSDDGSKLTFSTSADGLIPEDVNGVRDIYTFDRQNLELTTAPFFERSFIQGTQLTIANTSESRFAVSGVVSLQDSLLSNSIVNRNSLTSTFNVIDNVTPGSDQFGSLTRVGFSPPVHPLLRGNPAIDAGSLLFVNSVDQLGNVRTNPDIGAVEAVDARVSGTVYVDLNQNERLDSGEPTLSDRTVTLESGDRSIATDFTGSYSFDSVSPGTTSVTVDLPPAFSLFEPQIQIVPSSPTLDGSSGNARISFDGQFIAFSSFATNLLPNDANGIEDIFLLNRSDGTVVRVNESGDGTSANSFSTIQAITSDGRYVAFTSLADNLVPGDTNSATDVFVYDAFDGAIERVNVLIDGTQANGFSENVSLSADGRFVAFSSTANNLVPDDLNDLADVFVVDRETGLIERVSVASDGSESFGIAFGAGSNSPKISADGRYVAFLSDATNLVPGDTNVRTDVFLFDRDTDTIQRVSVAADGSESSEGSFSPDLSADGRFVSFASLTSDLVPGDTNGATDVFLVDIALGTIERVSVAADGTEGMGFSNSPSLSSDGRFVTFTSTANNLVPGDTNDREEVFVRDRATDSIRRLSVDAQGGQANGHTFSPQISGNGQFVVFTSEANNLVALDTNDQSDLFLTPNPLAEFDSSVELFPGDVIHDLNFGLIPDPGAISGRLFDDSEIQNQVYDIGETVLSERTVFIDENLNGFLDQGERFTVTDTEGIYRFVELPAHREHVLVAINPPGFEQVVPGLGSEDPVSVFLPAGRTLTELDFGFRPIVSTGQSSDSTIRGRVLTDSNRNGVIDAGDAPLSGQIVYLDGSTLGVRDFSDPQTVTDVDGRYSFTGLASTLTPVRLQLDDESVQVAPLGNDLLGTDSEADQFPLDEKPKQEGNPQSVVTGDYNGDGFADVAVILAETNQLSIRLNDQSGGFTSEKFDFTLSELASEASAGSRFAAPIALVSGQFDADPKMDFAIAGNFTGNVLVLLNFDSDQSQFESAGLHAVGEEPQDIAIGNVGGDDSDDLIVLSKGNAAVANDETVHVLTNDGAGVFTVGPPLPTGGQEPVSLSVGDFNGDESLDVAVTHSAPRDLSTTFGGVTVLTGDGNGGLVHDGNYFQVQATPLDSAVGDFNADQRPDLAVVNFSTNSISILTGESDGTLRVQVETLGTATGAVDVAVADIDNDGDDDIVTTKLSQRQVSIFRNVGVDPATGEVRFEPQENIGLGQFQFAERMPFAIANLDNDNSGPNQTGTLDIVAIPQRTDTLFVLRNQLTQGSRRVAVTGASTDVADGIDFLVQPATLLPSFGFGSIPTPIVEDSGEQTVSLTNVTKGRDSGPALQFVVTSSDPSIVAGATVDFVDGSGDATLRYSPVPNASGTSVVTVQAIDSGADQEFGTFDDGEFASSLTVTIQPVNDPPTFDFASSLIAVDQDSGPQLFQDFVTGISAGGGPDENIQTLSDFIVTTSNGDLFAVVPSIDRQGQLTFTPAAGSSGAALIEVQLNDDGGTLESGIDRFSASFGISITSPDPASIILEGDGNTFVFTESGTQLDGVQLIDIRGTGDNTLMLDVARIRELFQNGSITVISDAGDEVVFDEGWEFVEAVLSNGQLVRRFEQLGAAINLMGPDDFTNPISEFDVNASGDVSALDALVIINELAGRQFSDGGTSPEGGVRDPGSIDLSGFRFYDVTRDLRITALDALRVINQLARQSASSEQIESELVAGISNSIALDSEFVDEPTVSRNSNAIKIASFAVDERNVTHLLVTPDGEMKILDESIDFERVDEVLADWAI